MTLQKNVFRVFVSSTFVDMKLERRILQKDVFPKLQKFCALNGSKFEGVDLRWGINEDVAAEHKTLEICLKEIERCQRVSPKPNFLILLGNRYGWQPLPAKIPGEEMDLIYSVLSKAELNEIQEWYLLDENAIPSEYILQNRKNKFKTDDEWYAIEHNIQNSLRRAVGTLTFTQEKRNKYFTSATHQEIIHGALLSSATPDSDLDHVFAFARNTSGLNRESLSNGFIDSLNNNPDPFASSQLLALRQELEMKLGDHYHTYKAKWENGALMLDNPEDFGQQVYTNLRNVIERQIKELKNENELNNEIVHHHRVLTDLVIDFVGRSDLLSHINDQIIKYKGEKVVTIIGPSGSGKSGLVAKCIQHINSSSAAVIYRFIGTSSTSSTWRKILLGICGQIALTYDQSFESILGNYDPESLDEIPVLVEILEECMEWATEEKPLYIFLDAVDQITDLDPGEIISLIPAYIEDNVSILLTGTPEIETWLHGSQIIKPPLLLASECAQILDQWMEKENRQLTTYQREYVLQNAHRAGLPLYMKLAFEKSKHWHSYEQYVHLPDHVEGIILDFFSALEKDHTQMLVQHVIGYMLSGRNQGLTEEEIMELLVFDKEYWSYFIKHSNPFHQVDLLEVSVTKIPWVVWSRLYYDLQPFLVEREMEGNTILTFFHRSFITALKKKYLESLEHG